MISKFCNWDSSSWPSFLLVMRHFEVIQADLGHQLSSLDRLWGLLRGNISSSLRQGPETQALVSLCWSAEWSFLPLRLYRWNMEGGMSASLPSFPILPYILSTLSRRWKWGKNSFVQNRTSVLSYLPLGQLHCQGDKNIWILLQGSPHQGWWSQLL